MKIDNCLILSAGYGTRMGKIGKYLPKVLWPVFSQSLLELQIKYAIGLGARKIFVNVHHHFEKIINFVKEKNIKDVKIIFEQELLDGGGAIHNLLLRKEINRNEILLVINGDQFSFFPNNFVDQLLMKLNKVDAILVGSWVESVNGYNELIVSNGLLKSITPPPHNRQKHITYSGVALVKTDRLKMKEGPSKFFETVADFQNLSVGVEMPSCLEYWDFGTKDRYFYSMFKLYEYFLKNIKGGLFFDFCKKNNVFVEINSCSRGIINCSNNIMTSQNDFKAIVLASDKEIVISNNGIYYYDIFDDMDVK